MSEKMISLLAACAVTAAGLAIAAPAVAQQQTGVVTATITEDIPVRYVSYSDLNLAQVDGEQRLVKRVKYAVRGVCIDSTLGEAMMRGEEINCRGESWQRAEPQISRAVQRAREIAAKGYSAIAPVAISISVR